MQTLTGDKKLEQDPWGVFELYRSTPTSPPAVSVLLSVKDGLCAFIESCEALERQTLPDFEVIVVDDGSKENISDYVLNKMRSDPRWVLIKQANIGLTKSLIRASQFARGLYIARQDADDISLPERLKMQLDLATQENCDLVFSKALLESDHQKKVVPFSFLFKRFSPELFRYGNIFVHGTLMIKRSLLMDVNYDPHIKYAQDYDLYCRLSKKNLRWGFLETPVYVLKLGQNNISLKNLKEQNQFASQICKSYFGSSSLLIPGKSKIKKLLCHTLRYISSFFNSYSAKVIR